MRTFYTPGFKQPFQETDLTDAINAKLMENVEMGNHNTQLDNLRSYVTALVVKLAEKGVLKAIDLEDGLVGYKYSVEDE